MTNRYVDLIKNNHERIIKCIDGVPGEAKWYVDKWTDSFGGIHGYCADKMFIGHDDQSLYYKIETIKKYLVKMGLVNE